MNPYLRQESQSSESNLDLERRSAESGLIEKLLFSPYRYDEMPAELKGFNWGAFFLTFVWGAYHRALWTLAVPIYYIVVLKALPFFSFPHEGIHILHFRHVVIGVSLGIVGLKILFGFLGNRWAWRSGHYVDANHFRMIQRVWAQVGFILVTAATGIWVAKLLFIDWRLSSIMDR